MRQLTRVLGLGLLLPLLVACTDTRRADGLFFSVGLGEVKLRTRTTGAPAPDAAYVIETYSPFRSTAFRDSLGPDDEVIHKDLPAGDWIAAIRAVPDRCTVEGSSDRQFHVEASERTTVTFRVSCGG